MLNKGQSKNEALTANDGTPIDYVLTAGCDVRLRAKSKSKTGLTHPHLLA